MSVETREIKPWYEAFGYMIKINVVSEFDSWQAERNEQDGRH
jgi:hypothetical protein